MKKVLFLLLAMTASSMVSTAQDQIKRPKDSGVKEFDQFKNQSFDIYEASISFKKKAEGVEKFEEEDLKKANDLRNDLRTLLDKADEMKANAKKLKSIKGIKAGKNMVPTVKALDQAKANFESIADKF